MSNNTINNMPKKSKQLSFVSDVLTRDRLKTINIICVFVTVFLSEPESLQRAVLSRAYGSAQQVARTTPTKFFLKLLLVGLTYLLTLIID